MQKHWRLYFLDDYRFTVFSVYLVVDILACQPLHLSPVRKENEGQIHHFEFVFNRIFSGKLK